jgi:hypothetical protein
MQDTHGFTGLASANYVRKLQFNRIVLMKEIEYIKINEWAPDYADNAYHEGYFVEAIQVLHGWIEIQARSLLMLVGSTHFSTKLSDTWDTIDEIPYKDVVKSLFAVGQLTKQELDELLLINSSRNKMIHQIYKDPYDKIHHGFPKDDYDYAFKRTMVWADKMREKNETIIA